MKHRNALAIAVSLGILLPVYIGYRELQISPNRVANAAPVAQTKIAPDFPLRSLDGRSVKLSDFRGKIVVLNFWATWCAPCRVEMPSLIDLYDKYRARGVEIIGVSMDDGAQERVSSFVAEMKVNYQILLGNQFVADLYGGLRLLPQTVFIKRDGTIKETMIGMREEKDFEAALDDLLSAQPQK
jgi:cytochrome c biogenesis protein CcmG/thiol:disulfide interchange protein DsbE